jgi:hypothetical protein
MDTRDLTRLEEIKHEGHQRRSRRYRRNATFAACGTALILAFGAVMTVNHGSNPPPQAARQTDHTGRCTDSTDPSCGPFKWVPSPASNRPLRASLDAEQAILTVS